MCSILISDKLRESTVLFFEQIQDPKRLYCSLE